MAFAVTNDPSSCSNITEVVANHFDLDAEVDFTAKRLRGTITVDFSRKESTQRIILDVHCLDIGRVLLVGDDGVMTELSFEIISFTDFGSALHINTPSFSIMGTSVEEIRIRIEFVAGSGPGLCWLSPEQTAGKAMPYLFTQGQAALNRSIFPCQDTPSVKSTFSAKLRVPVGFKAVMSAAMLSCEEGEPCSNPALTQLEFEMKQKIPVYLLAFVVGDLASAPIGPRSRVYTEPCLLSRAVHEFDGVPEEYLSTGERLFGPYLWERYDLVVMPPCFPFGGMENPRLTFVTPCLLAGDRSLGDVVAHEIAHSWFGNLVTNASWGEFWLNEGFTMFAQRRITEEVHGVSFTALEATTGLSLLHHCVRDLGEDSAITRLRVPIGDGVNPDDTYNECAYEKGYAFVCYLRDAAGGNEPFERFLRAYCERFKFRSICAEDMFNVYFETFPELKAQGLDTKPGFEFQEVWLDRPGMPVVLPDYSAAETLTAPARALAGHWLEVYSHSPNPDLAGGVSSADAAWMTAAVAQWPTYQKLHFLDLIIDGPAVPANAAANAVRALAVLYGFNSSGNAEIRLRWASVVLRYEVGDFFGDVRAFLRDQGKQKYTLPLYRMMMRGSSELRAMAISLFHETKLQLHDNVRSYVERIVGIEPAVL